MTRCYPVPRRLWPCVFRSLTKDGASFTTGRTTWNEVEGGAVEVLAGASAEMILERYGLRPTGRPRVDPWPAIIKRGELGHLPGPRSDDAFEIAFRKYASELERVRGVMAGGAS